MELICATEVMAGATKALFTKQDMEDLKSLTVESLLEYMRQEMVGKLVSREQSKTYFTPTLHVAGFTLSIQLGHELWSAREDKYGFLGGVDHSKPMSEAEFDDLTCGSDIVVNFCMRYRGNLIFSPGPATLEYIAGYLNNLTNLED